MSIVDIFDLQTTILIFVLVGLVVAFHVILRNADTHDDHAHGRKNSAAK